MTAKEKSELLFFKSGYIEIERKYRELIDAICSKDDPRNDHAGMVRVGKVLKAYHNKDYGYDDECDEAIQFLYELEIQDALQRRESK